MATLATPARPSAITGRHSAHSHVPTDWVGGTYPVAGKARSVTANTATRMQRYPEAGQREADQGQHVHRAPDHPAADAR